MMRFIIAGLFLLSILACESNKEPRKLPILGFRDVVEGDTIYPKVRDFSFVNQDSQEVTNATFDGKIYVVDFFFIHCPTICPKVKAQAKRIYDRYEGDPRISLLSHSIDIENDTVAALNAYAKKLDIQSAQWHLVTGDHDEIYEIADDYFSAAKEDPDSPGGFDHSGRLILVDKDRYVRSFCNGTDPKDVDRFMEDIDILLDEQFALEK